jgi:NAD(P)H-hydrate epimerase
VSFRTSAGITVPAVTAEQMREVDRIAVREFGLGILQMMENAGRILAAHVMLMVGWDAAGIRSPAPEVTVLAGAGGNGGGGLCCARHLHNRGIGVSIVLDRDATALAGAARHQLTTLEVMGLRPLPPDETPAALRRSSVVVDALVGYGLRGTPAGRTAELIDLCNREAGRVLALDVPSGLNATTGEAPGPVVRADRTLTLALPKTGLRRVPGDLYLGDIGIPPEVYRRLALDYTPPFGPKTSVRLEVV